MSLLPNAGRRSIACVISAFMLVMPAASHAAPVSEFSRQATALCREIINQRDFVTFEAGTRAGFEIVKRIYSKQGAPNPSQARRLAQQLDAKRAAIHATRERLAALDPRPEGREAWRIVLSEGDSLANQLERRIALLQAGDWNTREFQRQPELDGEALGLAHAALGLTSRDCEVVFTAPGPLPGRSGFITEAADRCADIVERRMTSGFEQHSTVVMEAVAAANQRRLSPSDGLRRSLEYLRNEWLRTLEDVQSVAVADVTDAQEWSIMIAASQDRVAGFKHRIASLDDPKGGETAFLPGAGFKYSSGGDLTRLGLAHRDCRAIRF